MCFIVSHPRILLLKTTANVIIPIGKKKAPSKWAKWLYQNNWYSYQFHIIIELTHPLCERFSNFLYYHSTQIFRLAWKDMIRSRGKYLETIDARYIYIHNVWPALVTNYSKSVFHGKLFHRDQNYKAVETQTNISDFLPFLYFGVWWANFFYGILHYSWNNSLFPAAGNY